MSRITHREYRVRSKWRQLKWHELDLTHYYLMQIAAKIDTLKRKRGGRINLEPYKLKTSLDKAKESRIPMEQRIKQSQSVWFGVSGLKR